jgi:DUF917 family protein
MEAHPCCNALFTHTQFQDGALRHTITVQDVEDIAFGGAVLGTGGGGDPYVGKLMAQRAIELHGSPQMISVEDVPDDEYIMCAAGIGAPTVLIEKILRGDEAETVFRALEAHLGRKAYAVMAAEAGGVNGTIPIAVAATLKLPLVDADLIGRAFPEIQLAIPTLHGIAATPMVVADEKGNHAVLSTISNHWTELIARSMTAAMGGQILSALYTMTGRQAKYATVPRTQSLCLRIGQTLREALHGKGNTLHALLAVTGGTHLFRGKILDLDRKTEKGHVRGVVTIQGLDEFRGDTVAIDFQNENLIARSGERVLAAVPDLITILDQDTSYPITTEGLKYGLRVNVIGIPCYEQWRTPEGLALGGPQHFGYDTPYQPLAVKGAQ